MNTTTASLPRTISLVRPWPLRWWDAAARFADAVRSALKARREARAAAWHASAMAELDDHVLQDIGVPDWVRAEVAARREASLHCAQLNSRHLFDRSL